MGCISAKMFKAYLDSKEMKSVFVDDNENVLRIGIDLDKTDITILIFFSEDDHDVHLLGRDFVKVPGEAKDKILKVVNQCNRNYRWMKFSIDDDSVVLVEADAIIDIDSCATEVYELMIRMVNIVGDSYPAFMKCIWSD